MKTMHVLLKNIYMTPGAAEEVPKEEMLAALQRHCTGDWGDLCEEDRQENDDALQKGTRILSAYRTHAGTKFWVITDAGHEHTTVLLPDEY